MSRWVQPVMEHSNAINRNYIQMCILGMLQNNPLSIRLTIQENTIINLIHRFFEEANRLSEIPIKYMQLFSTFMKCDDGALKQNQNIILKHFFNSDNPYNFKFRVEYRH